MRNYVHKLTYFSVFLLPALFIYITFLLYPILSSSYYSLTEWNGITKPVFIGLDNFVAFFNDSASLKAIKNTLLYAFLITVIQNVLGLLLAVLLDMNIRSRKVLRMIFFTPVILSSLVVSYLWLRMLDPSGVINAVLELVHLDGLKQVWLGDAKMAFMSIVVMSVWQFIGYSMVIYLANLQTIPESLKEAAAIDGANAVQRFFNVTFPLLAPSLTINLLLSAIGSMKIFDPIFLMTKGGPFYATESVTFRLFEQGFRSNKAGFGSATSIVLFLLILLISLPLLAYLRRREMNAQ
ncbi:carbohydrate ABC transporter permease [Cohnella sp. WQ 127256]|uniref:carbohydrate ABC transporter permease n=1 Tax=Cohnella sp. WQ 127256 TaxID=2938790 RepID=UPI00211846A4|nr:sugar ABC transporter permease [Cohnella sp. WQ 127256]